MKFKHWLRALLVGVAVTALGVGVSQVRTQMAPDSMPITVQADRVLIGTEFVPRFLDLPRVKQVASGETFELPAHSVWDYVEVQSGGHATVSRTHDTYFQSTHFFVLPGGDLDVGTEADPIPANIHVTFVISDVPIDLHRDPFQWGNAILNFGHESRVGAYKLAWSPITTELVAGATSFTLPVKPVGWVNGDELFITDTNQPTLLNPIRLESKVTVQSIDGNTVTLSKSLDFEHLAQREPDGTIVLLPRVANLTRNIVIRSEGQGTPGHIADVGHQATFDIRYNEIDYLGRTKAIPLDNTNVALTHIGTNEKGRYGGLHPHHTHGFGSLAIGNVARGVGINGTKWGFAIHDTSDIRVEDNICYDFAGACFVTEDGPEVRNTFKRNFATHVLGTNPGEVNVAQLIVDQNPGSEGAGLWLHGIQNIIEGNESWNSAFGIVLVQNGAVATIAYPSQPGGMPDTFLNFHTAIPISFADNVSASNQLTGLEYWAVSRFPAINQTSSYNGRMAVQQAQSDPAAVYLVNPSLIGKDGTTVGMHVSMAYTDTLEVSGGGRVLGHADGLTGAGGVTFTKLVGSATHPLRMSNVVDLDMRAVNNLSIEDYVVHTKYQDYPEQFTVFSPAEVWDGQPPLPRVGRSYFPTQRGSEHYIKNYQGHAGENYRLIMKQALSTYAAWWSGSIPGYHNFNVPEQWLSNGQAWEKYGMAPGGEVIYPADVVPLVGLINGFARNEGPVKYGPPRAVMTYPNAWDSAIFDGDPSDRFVWGFGVMTGDPTGTSDVFLFSLDEAPAIAVQQSEFGRPGSRSFALRASTEGVHTVRTWRADLDGVAIPSSEMSFTYSVGPVVIQPPPTLCQDHAATNYGGALPCVYAPPPVCPVITVQPLLSSGQVGTPYTQPLSGAGGVGPYSISAGVGTSLPGGLMLVQNTLVGTPTEAGTFRVVFQVVDANNCVGLQVDTLVIAVQPPPPPPPPTQRWVAVPLVIRQSFVNGVPENRFEICTTEGCSELVVKP